MLVLPDEIRKKFFIPSLVVFAFFVNPLSSISRLRNNHSIDMYVIRANIKNEHDYRVNLYSRRPIVLKALLLYGKDLKRELQFLRAPASAKLVATLIALFLILATIVLYIFRRRFSLRGDNLGASFFDCLIPFIGGSNLRMEHRFERWFFGIMLVGAFFTLSVFGGDLVDSVVRVSNPKIRTFEELSKRDANINIITDETTLVLDRSEIEYMLR